MLVVEKKILSKDARLGFLGAALTEAWLASNSTDGQYVLLSPHGMGMMEKKKKRGPMQTRLWRIFTERGMRCRGPDGRCGRCEGALRRDIMMCM